MEHARKKEKKHGKQHLIIELIILLAVIVTIAFFAVPQLVKTLDNSRQSSADNDAKIVALAAKTWLTEQVTKELVPPTEDGNLLNDDAVKEILAIAQTIDAETATTVKIILKGKDVPDCYELSSVELTKKKFVGIASN